MSVPRLPRPARGDIWWVDFDPIAGHEQAGKRPALIISADAFNRGPQRLVIVVPLTRTIRSLPLHIPFNVEDCGPQTRLTGPGAIRCDQVRTVSLDRFLDNSRAGHLSPRVMAKVEDVLRAIMGLTENS